MTSETIAKPSFKQQMLQVREDTIVQTVNRLLAEKGFEAMTVDEVAAQVGIAKASLYKHFASKEDLAVAAMVRVMRQAQAFIAALPVQDPPLQQLRAVVRWALQLKLAGGMPSLPSQNSSLRASLAASHDYMDGLIELSDRLGGWIEAAQAAGELNPQLPAIAILYTFFARACDPVVEFLKMGGLYTDAQIEALVLSTCFEGLVSRQH
jgi:AcrR family transcriptional regulator